MSLTCATYSIFAKYQSDNNDNDNNTEEREFMVEDRLKVDIGALVIVTLYAW